VVSGAAACKFHLREEVEVSCSSIYQIYQWDVRSELFRQTGNEPRTSIVGVDLLNLITYITAWLVSSHNEMAAFIFNEGGVSTYVRQSPSA
jgi:hypothetical protein